VIELHEGERLASEVLKALKGESLEFSREDAIAVINNLDEYQVEEICRTMDTYDPYTNTSAEGWDGDIQTPFGIAEFNFLRGWEDLERLPPSIVLDFQIKPELVQQGIYEKVANKALDAVENAIAEFYLDECELKFKCSDCEDEPELIVLDSETHTIKMVCPNHELVTDDIILAYIDKKDVKGIKESMEFQNKKRRGEKE